MKTLVIRGRVGRKGGIKRRKHGPGRKSGMISGGRESEGGKEGGTEPKGGKEGREGGTAKESHSDLGRRIMKDELQDEHTAPRAAINSNKVGGGDRKRHV